MIRSTMPHLFVFILLTLAGPAGATQAMVRPACGERALTTTTPPSPLAVDPEDEQAILAFINQVTPLPSKDKNGDLERSLKSFWARYRPDLNDDAIDLLIQPHRPSGRGLSSLRSSVEVKRRPEAGRLRLFWVAFLKDTFPEAPAPHPAAIHRAEALALNQKAHEIAEYLQRFVQFEVRIGDDSLVAALLALYHTYLSESQAPILELKGVNGWDRGLELVAMWRAYVDALVSLAPVTATSAAQEHSSGDGRADPSTVPDDPRAMVEFLMKRFPEIKLKDHQSTWRYLAALRGEAGLGPSRLDIPAAAFGSIRRREGYQNGERLRAIWEEYLNDRRKKAEAAE